ncbi:MAG: hypothetical protein ACRDHZ_07430, partial [Ktedonobacteraceae bacterium]
MSKRTITIEDLYEIAFLSNPRTSPDGQRVAYVVTEVDARKHAYRSSIWAVPSVGGAAKRLTTVPANANTPRWSPDGCWLAFVSEREGEASRAAGAEQKKLGKDKSQIWLLPTDGGEARQLTFLQHGASQPVWSPDSQWLAFSAAVGPLDEETEDGKPLPKARVIDRFFYKLDGAGFTYERRSHLFLLNVAGGEPVQLTDGDWNDGDAAWSPAGKHLIFASSRAEDRLRMPTADLYMLAITQGKAGELHCITDGTLDCGGPVWSPNGQTIAFQASLKLRSGGHDEIYTIAANAKQGQATSLTHEFEGTFQDSTNTDGSSGLDQSDSKLVWSPDGKTIYALATHRGATRVFTLAVGGNNAHPATLTPGDIHVRDFSA